MAKFLITARKWPQLELDECVGNYEFCVVPKSLFSVERQPLASNDKSKLIHLPEELSDSTLPTNLVKKHDDSCIIIDGIAVVNKVVKDNLMKTCQVCFLFTSLQETCNFFKRWVLNLRWISKKTIIELEYITKAAAFESFHHQKL